jgi:hypothetical protein
MYSGDDLFSSAASEKRCSNKSGIHHLVIISTAIALRFSRKKGGSLKGIAFKKLFRQQCHALPESVYILKGAELPDLSR